MELDNLTIKEAKELAMMFNKKAKTTTTEDMGIQIAILQRGWIFIGFVFKTGSYFTIKNANCIRSWGTTKGLGELAFFGPLAGTKLEPSPEIKCHELTVVALMKVDESKWQGKI